jgi:hypothetical protein
VPGVDADRQAPRRVRPAKRVTSTALTNVAEAMIGSKTVKHARFVLFDDRTLTADRTVELNDGRRINRISRETVAFPIVSRRDDVASGDRGTHLLLHSAQRT